MPNIVEIVSQMLDIIFGSEKEPIPTVGMRTVL
jgi:hypothetical protein